jgi:hypothetical protein
MKSITISPHNDDGILFAAYLTIIWEADVFTVLRSVVQEMRGYGITATMREAEDQRAFAELDVLTYRQGPCGDAAPNWPEVDRQFAALAFEYEHAIIPAVEEGGHDQHNRIGEMAAEHFATVTRYTTYRRGQGRSRDGVEVEPQPRWISMKHRALACYESQINEPTTRPWFVGDLAEYVVG